MRLTCAGVAGLEADLEFQILESHYCTVSIPIQNLRGLKLKQATAIPEKLGFGGINVRRLDG